MLLILLDIQLDTLSTQGFLKCTTDCICNVEITTNPRKFCITFSRNSLFHYLNILMPEKFLLPSTLAPVCWNSSEEYLVKYDGKLDLPFLYDFKSSSSDKKIKTLKFEFDALNSSIENYVLKCIPYKDFKDFLSDKFKTVKDFRIVCANCGTFLTENVIEFQSVNKYYEGMSDLAESLFCHDHVHHDSTILNAYSLFIGDMYFYFHECVIESLRLSKNAKAFECMKCSTTLSLKKKMHNPYYIGFFSDKIMLVKSGTESSDTKKYQLDSALYSLSSVIQELLKPSDSCRLYLQCKIGEVPEIILLWISSQKAVQFSLHVINDDDIPLEKDFKSEVVYKVWYCICPPNSELSRKWKHNFDVEFYQISDNMLNSVTEILQKSSKYFPEEEDQAPEGFSCGYLPVYTSIE